MAVAGVTGHSPSRSSREIGRYAVILRERQQLQACTLDAHLTCKTIGTVPKP
jgi:hypothetical protein